MKATKPMKRKQNNTVALASLAVVLGLSIGMTGCKRSGDSQGSGDTGKRVVIQNKGSDTLVNVAIAWAEDYKKVKPNVSVEVSGGGSGTGIAGLMKGVVDIANSSRDMKPEEIESTKKATGKEPKEFVIGYDALAVYVHKNNPLEEISFDQLLAIYAEGGKVNSWSEIGITVPGCDGKIVRVSRQSNSGTYEFFREHVLDKKDFKPGSNDMNGSKEVVELVSKTPCAIGYSGMGYATPEVKMLKVKQKADGTSYEPTIENTLSKNYPISRGLNIYTLGEPEGEIRAYIEWIFADAGQKIVADSGYVPLAEKDRVFKVSDQ